MPTTTARQPVQVDAAAVQDLRAAVATDMPRAREIRHDLHRHPEIMFKETRTAGVVASELSALGVAHKTGLAGGTGVLGFLPATSAPDRARTVALRADMDALPIPENTGKAYASINPGVMHACGHDGHTAMLLATARVLAALPHRPNNVLFVFQPAEEGGAGGEKMCNDGVLNGSLLGRPADVIYGLHGWPELPLGSVATRTGPLLAATDEFTLTIRGKGGHAAYPHLCIDPIVVSAAVIQNLQSIAARRASPLDSVVVTVGSIHGGHAENVIPDTVEMMGTIRTLNDESRAMAEREFRRIVDTTAGTFGATAHVAWRKGYPVTVNHPEPTDRFRRVAREALGPDRLVEREHPTMGGEDFSFYGKHVPACFFFLGLRPASQNTYPNLHTPEFDFNDDAMQVGVEMFCRLATAAH